MLYEIIFCHRNSNLHASNSVVSFTGAENLYFNGLTSFTNGATKVYDTVLRWFLARNGDAHGDLLVNKLLFSISLLMPILLFCIHLEKIYAMASKVFHVKVKLFLYALLGRIFTNAFIFILMNILIVFGNNSIGY